jgi:hypothetical protein
MIAIAGIVGQLPLSLMTLGRLPETRGEAFDLGNRDFTNFIVQLHDCYSNALGEERGRLISNLGVGGIQVCGTLAGESPKFLFQANLQIQPIPAFCIPCRKLP